MRDFTFRIYENLLVMIKETGYQCIPYLDYVRKRSDLKKLVILRHDVDGKPGHSLRMAEIQNRYKVRGTYYFRNVPYSFDTAIIREIASLNHEIGFHYEDLSQCKGDETKAIRQFENFLDKLRQFYPVKTVCMHGSPLSKFDNRRIWDRYSYKSFGIEGEPYFDTDFDKVWYLTDTGRSWNNKTSIRDKVESPFDINVDSTEDLINSFYLGKLPDQIMINIHPQRWTDNPIAWYKELILQKMKNRVKSGLNKLRPQPTFDNRQIQPGTAP